jgi:acyl-CoA synthetase (AMP-forming)/AMP-acid ligase II
VSPLPAHFRRPLGRATIGDQLRRHARTQPHKTAFVTYSATGQREETSYAALDRLANRFAHGLTRRDVGRGDRVAVMAANRLDVVVAYYGALKVGAAFTGINPRYREAEVLQQLRHAEPALVVADAAAAPIIDGVGDQLSRPTVFVALDDGSTPAGWERFTDVLAGPDDTEPEVDVDEEDLALIVYTSGTEAEPKGVMIPHRNYLISTAPAWSWGLRTGPDDTWLFVMPFHTIAGIGSMTTLTLMGATLVLPATTESGQSLEIITREKVTVIAQTPTFYLALAAHEAFGSGAVGTVKRCLTYGGQVAPAAVDAWAEAAPEAMWGTYWGQSELSQLGSIGWFQTLADIPDQDPTWVGRPVTHLEVRVVGADGEDADIGELWCRSPSVMAGYFKDPERTRQTLGDGWVHTGDMMRTDASGNLFFYDRIKDMVKSGGMNVSSQEVVQGHPDVLRAAVVGRPDPYWSEVVTAFVIPRPGRVPEPAALIAHCRVELAGYKAPKAVYIVEALPVDPQGKVLKRQLRAQPPDPVPD